MNIDEIKNIWKKDMNTLESKIKINEEKINKLEFKKTTTTFDKFLKISLAGKNMALVYAIISFSLIFILLETPLVAGIVGFGALAMVFSYFQHSPLKKLDLSSLSILELQKEISKFRKHTAKTAVYDYSIVFIWMITFGIGVYQINTKNGITFNTKTAITISIVILLWGVFTYFGGRKIYKNIDVELNKSENDLKSLNDYQTNH